MNKHLKGLENPTIKERVLSNILARAERDRQVREQHIGFPAKMIDELAFNLPSKNDKFNRVITKYSSENPNAAKVAQAIGFLVGGILPGGVAVKGLSKIGKLSRVLKGGGLKQAMSQGAVYGTTGDTIKQVVKGDDDLLINALANATAGSVVGGALGVASPILKKAASIVKSKSGKIAAAREEIGRIRQDLAKKLNPRDFAHIRNIKGEREGLKINTLLHNPTENSKTVADALYQMSTGARQIINRQKDLLGAHTVGLIEKSLKKASGVGEIPDADRFIGLVMKRGQAKAKPLYEEAYSGPAIELSERIQGSPSIQTAIKKAFARVNKVDAKKPDFAKNSPRILDKAKRNLDDEIQSLLRKGKENEARDIGIDKDELIAAITKNNPKYAQARSTAKEYLKTKEAAEKGKEFLKEKIENIPEILKGLTDEQRLAYRLGALQDRLGKVRKNAETANFGEIHRHITNPEISKKLEIILPKGKSESLQKEVGEVKKAIDSMNELTAGSKTSKHESNKSLVLNALGAIQGRTRSIVNLGSKLNSMIGGKNLEREGKVKVRAMLNPATLLKYENIGKTIGNKNRSFPQAAVIINANEEG